MRTLTALGYGAFLLSLPFYVLASGSPQPSHAILTLAIAGWAISCLYSGRIPLSPGMRPCGLAVSLFAGYAIMVGVCWTAIAQDWKMLMHPLFVLFNLLTFNFMLSMYSSWGRRVLLWTGVLCAVS